MYVSEKTIRKSHLDQQLRDSNLHRDVHFVVLALTDELSFNPFERHRW